MISRITAAGKCNAIHPIIRVNATELYVCRLRNYKDLDTFVEEVSAVYGKKTLLSLYNAATEEPVSFLYVKLTSKHKDDVFYKRFDHKLVITHKIITKCLSGHGVKIKSAIYQHAGD